MYWEFDSLWKLITHRRMEIVQMVTLLGRWHRDSSSFVDQKL